MLVKDNGGAPIWAPADVEVAVEVKIHDVTLLRVVVPGEQLAPRGPLGKQEQPMVVGHGADTHRPQQLIMLSGQAGLAMA